jgi:hypothetical protein
MHAGTESRNAYDYAYTALFIRLSDAGSAKR